jgi:hypothetical protein
MVSSLRNSRNRKPGRCVPEGEVGTLGFEESLKVDATRK